MLYTTNYTVLYYTRYYILYYTLYYTLDFFGRRQRAPESQRDSEAQAGSAGG